MHDSARSKLIWPILPLPVFRRCCSSKPNAIGHTRKSSRRLLSTKTMILDCSSRVLHALAGQCSGPLTLSPLSMLCRVWRLPASVSKQLHTSAS